MAPASANTSSTRKDKRTAVSTGTGSVIYLSSCSKLVSRGTTSSRETKNWVYIEFIASGRRKGCWNPTKNVYVRLS